MFFGTKYEKKSKGDLGFQFWVAVTREYANFFLVWLFKQNSCLHREVNPQVSEREPDSPHFYFRFLWASSFDDDRFFEIFQEFCEQNGIEAQDKRLEQNIEDLAKELADSGT